MLFAMVNAWSLYLLAVKYINEQGVEENTGLGAWPSLHLDWLDATKTQSTEVKLLFGKSLTRSPIHHDRYADVIIAPMPDGKSEYRFLVYIPVVLISMTP